MAEDPGHDPLQAHEEPEGTPASGEDAPDRLDPGAVTRLFREHNRALVGYLTARLRSEQDAKEVAQEAYVRLLRLNDPGTASLFRAYLFKTAANLAIDRLRWRSVRHRAEQVHLFAELGVSARTPDEPERLAAAEEDAKVLQRCLLELPDKCRRVFELHRLQGHSQQQVAADLGFSERMVRRYVTYALVYCRLRLSGYAWTMQQGPKPAFLQNRVAYYVLGAEQWRYADSLEAVTSRLQPLNLHGSGGSSDVFHSGILDETSPGKAPPDQYRYDPRDLSVGEIESTLDGSRWIVDQSVVLGSSGKQLVYHSAPFNQDTGIAGFFRFIAWLAIDQPDTDFRVAIYEIDLHGGSVLLATDSLRARYRISLRQPELVTSDEPLQYDFNRFTFTSRLVRKGHRLRLVLGPGASIWQQRNFNSGRSVAEESALDARSVTVRLFHDADRRSTLFLPIGDG